MDDGIQFANLVLWLAVEPATVHGMLRDVYDGHLEAMGWWDC